MHLGGDTHLTYCTNVHPTTGLPQLRDNLVRHVSAVRAEICPDRPFGTGLWLPADALRELQEPGALADLQALLARQGLYVFTLNGFPYGAFHGRAIKERVFEPDWRSDARREYSDGLANVLAELLPEGVSGSISTLPGGFKPAIRTRADEQALADQLLAHAAHLHALHERTGKRIALALEPEPCGYLETIAETVAFFERHLRSERAIARLAQRAGLSTGGAADLVQRHLGVCLDTCHAAVEFEEPEALVAELRGAAIPIAKVQFSSGLRIAEVGETARAALAPYLDPVYLHQVVERRGGELKRYLDLPEALAALSDPGRESAPVGTAPALRGGAMSAREWRVHFHVPVFLPRVPAFDTTQFFLRAILALQRAQPLSSHLEVETYTWDVLPEEMRSDDLTHAIARELRFCLAELGAQEPGR